MLYKLSAGVGIVLCGIGFYLYYNRNKQVPYCVTPMNKTENFVFIDLHEEVISYIKKQNWSIIEMCAGNGVNLKKLLDAGIDSIGFDLSGSNASLVKYGVAGLVEQNYNDRVLLLIAGINTDKSINSYKGSVVILGGSASYLDLDHFDILPDITQPLNIITNVPLDKYNTGSKAYQLDIRPCYTFMREHQFKLIQQWIFAPSNVQEWISVTCFQIWIRE